MRNDIVIAFLAILFLVFIIFMFRFVFRSGADWSEYISERVSRRKPAPRLLREMDNRPRERLVEIALALGLAPYHWPKRSPGNDEGLVRARERYPEFLASLSDEELQQWIREKVQDTHSLLLNVALESLNGKGSSGQKKG